MKPLAKPCASSLRAGHACLLGLALGLAEGWRRDRLGFLIFGYKTIVISNTPTYTPEHKSKCNCNCTHTLTPKLTTPAACIKLQTTFCIGLQPHKRLKKSLKLPKHGLVMLAQAHVRTRGWGLGGMGLPERDYMCVCVFLTVHNSMDKALATGLFLSVY